MLQPYILIRLKLLWLFFFLPIVAVSQPINKLSKGAATDFWMLEDQGYTISEVVANKTAFSSGIEIERGHNYWLRLVVANVGNKQHEYFVDVFPNRNTTLYTFDYNKRVWIADVSNLETGDRPWELGRHPYQIAPNQVDTVYLRIDASGPYVAQRKLLAKVNFVDRDERLQEQQYRRVAWAVGCIVLLLFFLNNLGLYFGLKDRTVLHYLTIQIGSIAYLTSYWFFFDFDQVRVFSYFLADKFYFFDLNKLITHLSILVIFYGLVQLTRAYLQTKNFLPIQDRLLRVLLYVYIAISLVMIPINSFWFYLDYYTLKYDNIYCVLMIFVIIFTGFSAVVRKVPLAMPFLLANLLPMIFMLSIPIFHLTSNKGNNHWLPVFAVISQALGFSIALLTRTRAMESTLKERELVSQQLAFEIKEANYRSQLEMAQLNAEMDLEKERNELLNQKLDMHQRELASSALNMVQKNELLTLLRGQIQKLNWMDRYHAKKSVEELDQLLQSNIQLDNDWSKFKLHFEQVHPHFFEDLKKKHPSLTAKEIRLYTYFEMNLSHKEIAALLDIDQASVRRAKTRLFKKMNQDNQSL